MEQEYLCSIFLVKREEKVRRTVHRCIPWESEQQSKSKWIWSWNRPDPRKVPRWRRSFAEQIKDQDNSVGKILMNSACAEFHREKVDRLVERYTAKSRKLVEMNYYGRGHSSIWITNRDNAEGKGNGDRMLPISIQISLISIF